MINKRLPVALFAALSVAALAACGGKNTRESPSDDLFEAPETSGPDDRQTNQLLTESTKAIENVWMTLGSVAESEHPEYIDFLTDFPGDIPPELQKRISISWAGPLNLLVKKMAQEAGYFYEEIGRMPTTEIPVRINAVDQPIGLILRNAGYQAGSRAEVRVRPNILKVEVIYAAR